MTGSPAQPVLLVVDDNDINRLVASRMAAMAGCTVRDAADGEAAVAICAGGGIDIVLMDVQMPGMDGYTATRRIRESERGTGRHLLIVGLSAHGLPEDRTDGLAAGMDDYLVKPMSLATFRAALARLLPGRIR